jgi:hypothetical protein
MKMIIEVTGGRCVSKTLTCNPLIYGEIRVVVYNGAPGKVQFHTPAITIQNELRRPFHLICVSIN